jgi:N-acetyl-1-D-myo-inositol-2-amino-2-deoxy-alpha-D-glucopyranoside deacetylase
MALAGHGVRAATPDQLHPRALARPEAFEEQVDALVAVLAEVRPQVVVTYAADGGYGHPDHVRAYEITVAALRRMPARLFCTVLGRSTLEAGVAGLAGSDGMPFRRPEPDELPSVPDETITTRIDVTAQRAARIAALQAHATQVALWTNGKRVALAMSNWVAQPLLDVEEYMAADGGPAPADDLFGGIGDD